MALDFLVLEKKLNKNTADLIEENDLNVVQGLLDNTTAILKTIKQAIKIGNDNTEKLQAIQLRYYQLKMQIEERLSLLRARETLYGQTDLKQVEEFEQSIAQFCDHFPLYKTKLMKFKEALQSAMRISQEVTSLRDIVVLEEFINEIRSVQEFDLLRPSIEQLVGSLKTSYLNKEALLKNFAEEYSITELDCLLKPFDVCNKTLACFSFLGQVLYNPFEPPLEPKELLRSVIANNPTHLKLIRLCQVALTVLNKPEAKKTEFWSYRNKFDLITHTMIGNNAEKRAVLYDSKIAGIRRIQALEANKEEKYNKEPALIIGAGPSGLLHAIHFALKGQSYTLIEKRNAEKNPRLNTVTLGKWEAKELEILSFIGALTYLEDKVSFGHNRAMYMEVKLGDVENALQKTLISLSNNINPIQYETTVTAIGRDGKVTLRKNNTITEINPKLVIVADGARGCTKALLGIGQQVLAKPNFLIFSILKDENSLSFSTLFASIFYKISNGLKGLWLIFKTLCYALRHWTSIETAYSHVVEGGPSGISRLPDQDYLLRILREDEQKILTQYQQRLMQIDLNIKIIDEDINLFDTNENNEAALNLLKNQRNQLVEEQNKIGLLQNEEMQRNVFKMHGLLDFLHSVFNPKGHKMKNLPTKLHKNHLVEIVVSMAEESLVTLNDDTHVLIRGDADHITDPFSGTGCKTALEETLADYYFLDGIKNNMEQSILKWGHEHYKMKTLHGAFFERLSYRPGTESPAWYADLAFKQKVITKTEYSYFVRLCEKLSLNVSLNEKDQDFCNGLSTRLKKILIGFHNSRAHLKQCLRFFSQPTKASDPDFIECKKINSATIAEEISKGSPVAPLFYLYQKTLEILDGSTLVNVKGCG